MVTRVTSELWELVTQHRHYHVAYLHSYLLPPARLSQVPTRISTTTSAQAKSRMKTTQMYALGCGEGDSFSRAESLLCSLNLTSPQTAPSCRGLLPRILYWDCCHVGVTWACRPRTRSAANAWNSFRISWTGTCQGLRSLPYWCQIMSPDSFCWPRLLRSEVLMSLTT